MAGRLVPFDHPFFRRQGSWSSGAAPSFWDDPWTSPEWPPSRIIEQNFGMGFMDDDLLPATPFRGWYLKPRRQGTQCASSQSQATGGSGFSQVINDDKEFKVNLDVSHFRPDEVQVKNIATRVTVHCRHDEIQDEHGFIQREFTRSYVLPKEVDAMTIKSTLSADGVLSIFAPKVSNQPDTQERTIPIEQIGSP